MLSIGIVIALVFAVIVALAGIGIYVERSAAGRKWDNALVYSLALATYCTSWTFYGSVGSVASSGFLFTAVYLGPTLALILGYPFIRRLVRLRNRLGISSLADLLSIRYGRSAGIGALISVIAAIGIVPYIALQLKAIVSSAALISGHSSADSTVRVGFGVGIAVLMLLVSILLGMSELDARRRHRGLLAMLSVESVLKLLIFVTAGVFVALSLGKGMGGLVESAGAVLPPDALLGRAGTSEFIRWISLLLLAGSAIIFLPRQFHIAVVENGSEKHLRVACWLFPLYLLLINLFVFPVAVAGLVSGYPASLSDNFLLLLPLHSGQKLISLAVFLGGFLAASAMIVMETVTISTMVSNYLLVPIVQSIKGLSFFRKYLLRGRWLIAAIVLGFSCFYMETVGNTYALLAMGTISFAAVIQFAPVTIGAIYWRKANRTGAYLGLIAGFAVWAYTLFLPAFAKSGWLDGSFVANGLFGLSFLRAEGLFGIDGLDPISHGTFWSLLVNGGFFVAGSLAFPRITNREEQARMLFSFSDSGLRWRDPAPDLEIDLAQKEREICRLLSEYFPESEASLLAAECLRKAVGSRDRITILQLATLHEEVEKALSGAVGPVTAHSALMTSGVMTASEQRALSVAYASLLAEMKLSPREIKDKIDFFVEREALLTSQAAELQKRLAERDRENAAKNVELHETNRKLSLSLQELSQTQQRLLESSKFKALGEMSAGLSHEINTPLASIHLLAAQAREVLEDPIADRAMLAEMLATIGATAMRIGRIIQGLRSFSREAGADPFECVLVSRVIEDTLVFCEDRFKNDGVSLSVEFAKQELKENLCVCCRPTEISQVLLNLLNNARDAVLEVPDKWIRVGVRETDQWVEISIIDSGKGLASELRSKLFVPFFTTKPVGAGTGLGLSVSKGIVESHQGTLCLDEKSVHTCFLVRLPRARVQG